MCTGRTRTSSIPLGEGKKVLDCHHQYKVMLLCDFHGQRLPWIPLYVEINAQLLSFLWGYCLFASGSCFLGIPEKTHLTISCPMSCTLLLLGLVLESSELVKTFSCWLHTFPGEIVNALSFCLSRFFFPPASPCYLDSCQFGALFLGGFFFFGPLGEGGY